MGQDKRRVAKIIGAGFAALVGSILILAFGYLLGNSGGYYDAQADSYAQQIGEAADRRIESWFRQPDATIPATRECVEQAVRSARDEQRAEQDLSAQRQMAQWAWWLLIVTASGMPLTALGLILLLQTIWQGQEAVKASQRSADAAHEANRPWIEIGIDELNFEVCSGALATFQVILTNHGNSPATNVMVVAKLVAISMFPREPPSPLAPLVEAALLASQSDKKNVGRTVFPNKPEKTEIVYAPVPDEEIQALRSVLLKNFEHPGHIRFLLAVIAGYRFGNAEGRTMRSYALFFDASVIRYDTPDQIYSLSGDQIEQIDLPEGYAI